MNQRVAEGGEVEGQEALELSTFWKAQDYE